MTLPPTPIRDQGRTLLRENGVPYYVGDRVLWGAIGASQVGEIRAGRWRVKGVRGGTVAIRVSSGKFVDVNASVIGARWVKL